MKFPDHEGFSRQRRSHDCDFNGRAGKCRLAAAATQSLKWRMAKECSARVDEEFSVLLLQYAVNDAAAGDQFVERRFQLSPVLPAADPILRGSDRATKF